VLRRVLLIVALLLLLALSIAVGWYAATLNPWSMPSTHQPSPRPVAMGQFPSTAQGDYR